MAGLIASKQTDLYATAEFVDYIARLRKRVPPPTWPVIHAAVVRDFGYQPKRSALVNWWSGEGQQRANALESTLDPEHRAEDVQALTEIFSRKLTAWLRLSGDFMISSDWHVPHFSADMAEKYFAIAKRFGIQQQIIVGDFVNLDSLSDWDKVDHEDTWKREQAAASRLIEHFGKAFDLTYWIMGNHEVRWMRKLAFQTDLPDFAAQLIDKAKVGTELICSNYAYAVINDEWRLTHPKSYSRNGGTVPFELTSKYEQSVIGAHGHHVGVRLGRNNKRVGIDIGGMFDVERIGYVMREDSNHPMWNGGFAMLRNNCCYLFTDNPLLTDWDFWLPTKGRKL